METLEEDVLRRTVPTGQEPLVAMPAQRLRALANPRSEYRFVAPSLVLLAHYQ